VKEMKSVIDVHLGRYIYWLRAWIYQ